MSCFRQTMKLRIVSPPGSQHHPHEIHPDRQAKSASLEFISLEQCSKCVHMKSALSQMSFPGLFININIPHTNSMMGIQNCISHLLSALCLLDQSSFLSLKAMHLMFFYLLTCEDSLIKSVLHSHFSIPRVILKAAS